MVFNATFNNISVISVIYSSISSDVYPVIYSRISSDVYPVIYSSISSDVYLVIYSSISSDVYPVIYSSISILLIMPVSSATSQRSYSALRRLKFYGR
jgi:hypothetical protein